MKPYAPCKAGYAVCRCGQCRAQRSGKTSLPAVRRSDKAFKTAARREGKQLVEDFLAGCQAAVDTRGRCAECRKALEGAFVVVRDGKTREIEAVVCEGCWEDR